MTRTLIVEREAEAEIGAAMEWYDGQRPGLGETLAAELGAALARVVDAPHTFPRVAVLDHPRVRRAVLARFPYAIVFVAARDRVSVIAFAHGSRRPLYWAGRLGG